MKIYYATFNVKHISTSALLSLAYKTALLLFSRKLSLLRALSVPRCTGSPPAYRLLLTTAKRRPHAPQPQPPCCRRRRRFFAKRLSLSGPTGARPAGRTKKASPAYKKSE